MKKNDIKRLKRCVELYTRIIETLEIVYDNVYGEDEYLHRKDYDISVPLEVQDMIRGARNCRMWLIMDLRLLEEQNAKEC